MIYKECIDACFDTVKAAERCAFERKDSKECSSEMSCCIACAEICTLVGRLTARGCCTKDFYEFCAKVCDDCTNKCGKMEGEYAKACAAAAKRCAEACRKCQKDCEKCD
ncbi:MAG: four-helix bundle copper-binding protein [Proteobacteria bacterium]|nr:four-helix bundle copper-binding protein [Pseudomonadota bacterium]